MGSWAPITRKAEVRAVRFPSPLSPSHPALPPWCGPPSLSEMRPVTFPQLPKSEEMFVLKGN